jgi:hypothetical protein
MATTCSNRACGSVDGAAGFSTLSFFRAAPQEASPLGKAGPAGGPSTLSFFKNVRIFDENILVSELLKRTIIFQFF